MKRLNLPIQPFSRSLYPFLFLAHVGLFSMLSCGSGNRECAPASTYTYQAMTDDSLSGSLKWPEDLDIRVFADAGLVPSRACMAVSASGDVFVGAFRKWYQLLGIILGRYTQIATEKW